MKRFHTSTDAFSIHTLPFKRIEKKIYISPSILFNISIVLFSALPICYIILLQLETNINFPFGGHNIVIVILLPLLILNMSKLQVQQLNQLREIFARFDMDSDGSLTMLELAALLRSLGLKPSGDQLHDLLSNMDSNGNGSVEFDELVRTILPDLKNNAEVLLNQEQLLDVFKCFDRDSNGFISAAELAGAMAKMGQPLTYKELTEMIREADTDGDGVISFNEFKTIMARSASDFLGLSNWKTELQQ